LYQYYASQKHEIRHLAILKLNHLASSMCWCNVLLKGAKVKLSPQVCEGNCLGLFCGCNGESSTVCHQWTRWSSPSKQGSYSAAVSTRHSKTMFVLTSHYDVSITSWL